jgi:hypothetical protein
MIHFTCCNAPSLVFPLDSIFIPLQPDFEPPALGAPPPPLAEDAALSLLFVTWPCAGLPVPPSFSLLSLLMSWFAGEASRGLA